MSPCKSTTACEANCNGVSTDRIVSGAAAGKRQQANVSPQLVLAGSRQGIAEKGIASLEISTRGSAPSTHAAPRSLRPSQGSGNPLFRLSNCQSPRRADRKNITLLPNTGLQPRPSGESCCRCLIRPPAKPGVRTREGLAGAAVARNCCLLSGGTAPRAGDVGRRAITLHRTQLPPEPNGAHGRAAYCHCKHCQYPDTAISPTSQRRVAVRHGHWTTGKTSVARCGTVHRSTAHLQLPAAALLFPN